MRERLDFSNTTQAWTSYLNKEYIESLGRPINIFKLDKQRTKIHELYMEEEQTGRVHLKPFELRVLYDTGQWTGLLDVGLFSEKEGNTIFFANFDNMVDVIRTQKNNKSSKIFLKYLGDGIPKVKKTGEELSISIDSDVLEVINLKDPEVNTVNKLKYYLNNLNNFKCRIEGENKLTRNISDFSITSFKNVEIMFYVQDDTYENITDVIEMGDAILTEKNRLYEVIDAKPAGEFGWNYNIWRMECKLGAVDSMNLPDNWTNHIINNEYGLRSRIKME